MDYGVWFGSLGSVWFRSFSARGLCRRWIPSPRDIYFPSPPNSLAQLRRMRARGPAEHVYAQAACGAPLCC
jgi:hypothetical protein